MSVFIHQGEKPLTKEQAGRRGLQVVAKELSAAGMRAGDETILASTDHESLPDRLIQALAKLHKTDVETPTHENTPTYAAYSLQWDQHNAESGANNVFNHQLVAYTKAITRLAKYRLADGQSELTEQRPTAELDDNGYPIMETVVVKDAVDPLPPEVEKTIYDNEGGSSVVMIANPAIVQDDQERAIATATIAQIPQAVIDYYGSMEVII